MDGTKVCWDSVDRTKSRWARADGTKAGRAEADGLKLAGLKKQRPTGLKNMN